MNEPIGTLKPLSALERLDLMAEATAGALSENSEASDVGVVEIDPALSDITAFCERYQVSPSQAANCVILEAKRAERMWYAACVILASTRADVNGVARKFLDARKASFAPMEKAVELSNMEYGAITPVGLLPDWPILIDAAAAASPRLIIGSGIRSSKLIVSGRFLSTLPNATIVEGLARPQQN